MSRICTLAALAAVASTAACTGDLDPPWELDHDRIIAVRATPPGIVTGETSKVDALIGRKGGATSVERPELAIVAEPASLSDALRFDGTDWVVTAPSEERLASARTELNIKPGDPVPLRVGVSYNSQELFAVKTVLLGQRVENPSLVNVMIDASPPPSSEIVVGRDIRVDLSIDANDIDYDVSWLTSCGTMHDFDLPNAYLKVEEDDSLEGELAVILRDATGGVAWAVWPIQAE